MGASLLTDAAGSRAGAPGVGTSRPVPGALAGAAGLAPSGSAGRAAGALPPSGSTPGATSAVAGAPGAPPPTAASTPTSPTVPGQPSKGCEGEMMPAVTGEYSANGPLPTMIVNGTGPDGMYTVYRPSMLGANGFKHPLATWGNGITTDPSYYPQLLGAIASHGFVVVASNSSSVTTDLMVKGLDWLIAQDSAAGDYQGKLKTTCLVTIGYSLGGGASVGAGAHANVVATASMHGVTGASSGLHAPLLLLTAETDTFVTPAGFVTPTFNMSSVQTFYGTLSKAADPSDQGHLIPVDGALALGGAGSANLAERAAMIAWLRLWVYGDSGAKRYFFGEDCMLCNDPWVMPQRKNWP